MGVNETLVEVKLSAFTLESTHFIFNKWPIYTHDGASAKFSTNSQETDYSVARNNGESTHSVGQHHVRELQAHLGPGIPPQEQAASPEASPANFFSLFYTYFFIWKT